MAGEHFERWFGNNLLAGVKEGYTVIMDRARFHRKKQLEAICKKAKVRLLFLPAYSPDFNPIEKDWANMKRALRVPRLFVIYFRLLFIISGVRYSKVE
jgi:putative transposase